MEQLRGNLIFWIPKFTMQREGLPGSMRRTNCVMWGSPSTFPSQFYTLQNEQTFQVFPDHPVMLLSFLLNYHLIHRLPRDVTSTSPPFSTPVVTVHIYFSVHCVEHPRNKRLAKTPASSCSLSSVPSLGANRNELTSKLLCSDDMNTQVSDRNVQG